MADPNKLKGLGSLQTPKPASTLLRLARERQAERSPAEPKGEAEPEPVVEAPAKAKRSKGRPKLDYETVQLGARVRQDTYDRMQAVMRRERIGLGPLVDRAMEIFEQTRLEQAKAIGKRNDGESDDDYIARVFRF